MEQSVLCIIFGREFYYKKTKKSVESSNDKEASYLLYFHIHKRQKKMVLEFEDSFQKKRRHFLI